MAASNCLRLATEVRLSVKHGHDPEAGQDADDRDVGVGGGQEGRVAILLKHRGRAILAAKRDNQQSHERQHDGDHCQHGAHPDAGRDQCQTDVPMRMGDAI